MVEVVHTPGHGSVSKEPENDMKKAIRSAKHLLAEKNGAPLVKEEPPPNEASSPVEIK